MRASVSVLPDDRGAISARGDGDPDENCRRPVALTLSLSRRERGRTDAGSGEICKRDLASANFRSCCEQPSLPRPTDLAQQDLPGVAGDLVLRQHQPPAIAGMMLILSESATGVSSSFKNRMSSSL